ncbi:hypothetical protein ACTUSN_14075 [Pantoea ananatis]|uniref:hypothetical protein n=1 Tax=Pantoea ananas TaxID=553 RepID=UPI003FA40D0E
MGILDQFVDFLNLLGGQFPPLIGAMMVDYFILKSDRKVRDESQRRNALHDEAQTKNFGWDAIIDSLVGAVAEYYVTYGVQALNSIITVCLIYFVLSFIKGQITSQDR